MTPTAEFLDGLRVPTSRVGEPTWEVTRLFPVQGDWSEGDFFSLDLTCGFELVNGRLVLLPMPLWFHQMLVEYLHHHFNAHLAAHRIPGHAVFAPFLVRLGPQHLRQPDVTYLRPGRIVDPHVPPVSADLVMEVVSDGHSNRERDFVEKVAAYAAAGIPEYWIIDPKNRRVVVHVLRDATYVIHGEYSIGQQAISSTVPGYELDVAALFAAAERPLK